MADESGVNLFCMCVGGVGVCALVSCRLNQLPSESKVSRKY